MLRPVSRLFHVGRSLAVALMLTGSLIAVAPVTASAITCSGWTRVLPPDAGSGPNTLQGAAVTSARNAWAVSNYQAASSWTSRILHWNGSTWTAQTTPVPPGTELDGVAATSASSAWAVGDYYNSSSGHYETVIVHWDGNSWSRQLTPIPAGANEFLRGVVATSASNVWAVGADYPSGATVGKTLILRWDGNSWSRQPSPDKGTGTNALSGVAATSASSAWAVGQYNTSTAHPLIVHWNGSSWSRQWTPTPLGYEALHAVAATSRSSAWAVGQDPGAETLVLHWNGSSWSRKRSPNGFLPDGLNGVVATSASNMWAVGYYTSHTGKDRTLFIHWHNGAWYMPNPYPGTGDSALYGVAGSATTGLWAVGHVGNRNLAFHHC